MKFLNDKKINMNEPILRVITRGQRYTPNIVRNLLSRNRISYNIALKPRARTGLEAGPSTVT